MDDARDALNAFRERFPSGELASEQAIEAFERLIGPESPDDFLCVMSAGGLRGEFRGPQGLRQAWQDFFAGFETMAFSLEGLVEGPDETTMIELVRLSCRPKGTDAVVEQRGAAVYHLGEREVLGIEYYLDREEAFEAARPGGAPPN